MNILIAKTLLQSWINENDIALLENEAYGNFDLLLDEAEMEENEEIIECLNTIQDLGMIHILENKAA